MNLFRLVLSVFAIVNVGFWAILAWVWVVKPAWAARLPLQLGTDQRYDRKGVPTWGRLAAAIAGFWSVAAVLYLTTIATNELAFVALIVLAAIFLILGIGAAARVYHVLQLPIKSMPAADRRQKAL